MQLTLSVKTTAGEVVAVQDYLTAAMAAQPDNTSAEDIAIGFANHAVMDMSTGEATITKTLDIPQEKVIAYLALCQLVLPAAAQMISAMTSKEAQVLISTIYE